MGCQYPTATKIQLDLLMKNLVATPFLLLIFGSLSGQINSQISDSLSFKDRLTLGLEAGYTRSYLITNISSLAFTQYRPAGGYTVGVPIQYLWKKWFAIQADPGVMQKNYTLERTDFFAGNNITQSNTYIQLPLMAKFIVGDGKLKGFFNVGGYGGYWMAGHVKGSIANILDPTLSSSATTLSATVNSYNFNESYQFNSVKDNRVEWGWLAGAGISYQLTRKCQIYMEGRNTQSVTDQQKKYMMNQIPKYNQTYSLMIGCLLQLKGNPFKN
jgi:hypothetical protein